MADLLIAGEDNAKRTRVFVNHVDLYTGKNISKVRKMTKIYSCTNKGINVQRFFFVYANLIVDAKNITSVAYVL